MTLTVQAQVVNILDDKPKQQDKFLVDTNVWLLYYPRSSIPAYSATIKSHQDCKYTPYIKKALYAMSSLLYCGLSLAEIAHVIEKQEREVFSPTLNAKEYRYNYPAERDKVVRQVQRTWNYIKRTGKSADISVNQDATQDALNRFQTQLLDGYDLFILEAMKKAGIDQIITDDGDYVTVPGIRVFTANWSAIAAARSQGKLLLR